MVADKRQGMYHLAWWARRAR